MTTFLHSREDEHQELPDEKDVSDLLIFSQLLRQDEHVTEFSSTAADDFLFGSSMTVTVSEYFDAFARAALTLRHYF
jgi:hypothetical protein